MSYTIYGYEEFPLMSPERIETLWGRGAFGKMVSVDELPVGYYKEGYLKYVRPPYWTMRMIPVVAVLRVERAWKVYIGWPGKIDYIMTDKRADVEHYVHERGNPQGALDYGDTMSHEEAEALFPTIAKMRFSYAR
jgi:hypothetical protein